ncbi:glycoside hydrolase family 3 protein [Pseudocolwellia sp. HL-MZ7]|uniref:glycoside hydrolase family 3 protein n=1 Tax=Pseudocolwellia sp. HL-MZ7 TaxID=3400627 RepID=UPI003CF0EADE
MKLSKITLLSSSLVLLATGCSIELSDSINSNEAKAWAPIKSEVKIDAVIEAKVTKLLNSMTLEQKVAQMIQPEIRDITPEDMRKYGFGSYLNGGGAFPKNNKHSTPQDWIELAETMYQASVDDSVDGNAIPTMWGTDAVHGHNNVIGATLFPHNIGLGAANNAELMTKIAQITATEVMVTGIDWVFAPTVATVRNDRWGRTYEGYSEDPEIVKLYASAVVKGLQGSAGDDFLGDDRVISTVKHFVGDGGTKDGDDQGDNQTSEQDLYKLHAQGYVSGLAAGAQSVMASFNSWNGEKIHGSHYLLTEVLKEKMGFDGFVVGDWNGHGQVKGCSNESCPQAVNAGLDIFMVPTDAWKPLYENTIKQVKNNTISIARIDDAVKRILRVKFRAGLFDKPSPAKRMFSGKTALIGSDEHRKVARQAVQESLVLLKNKANLLPISPKLNILVAGDGADNIGKQSGGWSITWQGTGNTNKDFPGGTSIYSGIEQQVTKAGGSAILSIDGSFEEKPDVAVVVFGEEPYAEGQGDIEHLYFESNNKKSLALLKQFKQQGIPVVSIFITGRPMWVNAEINASDAFVAAWLPGSEGQGIADVILADENNDIQHNFMGKLSFSWPKDAMQTEVNRFDENYDPLFPYGFGLTYGDKDTLTDILDETINIPAGSVKTDDKVIEIFKNSIKQPWSLWLYSGDKDIAVYANAHQLAELNYRTVDKLVQEDAFRISLTGNEKSAKSQSAGVMIKHVAETTFNFAENVSENSRLQFSVSLANRVSGDVYLSTYCSADKECGASVNIGSYLNKLPLSDWQTFSIDLSCFSHAGMDFSKTAIPFELSSKGNVELSIADIVITDNIDVSPTVSCGAM